MWNWIKKYRGEVILGCLLVYIAFLLFYNLWVQSLWIDEWFSSYVAKKMSIEGFYKSRYFLYEWLQALSFKFAGISDFTARFPSVIFQLWSVLLMYLIPYKLTKNKYIGLISAAVFWFLYWELAWGRDARFYSLIQFLFLWWLTLLTYWIENKKIVYLSSSILLAVIWILLHPFIFCLWAVIFLVILQQYNKAWNFKSLFLRKNLVFWWFIAWCLVGLVMYCLNYWMLWKVLTWSLLWNKPSYYISSYFVSYSKHIWIELWLLSVFWVLWMMRSLIKKKRRDVVLFLCPFLLFVYALCVKWYLIHFRYALLIFPLLIVSGVLFLFDMLTFVKSTTLRWVLIIMSLVASLMTARFQFFPKVYYSFDSTSPQPDFKQAYASIPDWENVISWFPTLCDWYYWNRGNCMRAVRVDLIHDGDTDMLENSKNESYTWIPYMESLDDLDDGVYFFVMDNLTSKSNDINKKLYQQLKDYWTIWYESWKTYNNVIVSVLAVEW